METMHDEREFEMPRVRRRTSLTVAVEDPRGWDSDGAAGSVKSKTMLTRRPSLFVVKSSPRVPQRSLFSRVSVEEAGSPMVESPMVGKQEAHSDDKENAAMNGAMGMRPSWLQPSAPTMHAAWPTTMHTGAGVGTACGVGEAADGTRPQGLNDAWANVMDQEVAGRGKQQCLTMDEADESMLLLSRIATNPEYPKASGSSGAARTEEKAHTSASASAGTTAGLMGPTDAASSGSLMMVQQRLRTAERSRSSPAPLGVEYTLNRPAKTPTVMRVRRGNSYKIRRMRMSAEPEELAAMPAELLAAAEETVHEDPDPLEDASSSAACALAVERTRTWEPASPPHAHPTHAASTATPACPMTEMTLMNSMHDCLGMTTPPMGARRPPRSLLTGAAASMMQLDGGGVLGAALVEAAAAGGGGDGELPDVGCCTPELHSSPPVGTRPGAPPGAASFTLMRAACTGVTKSVHLVRHGESEYNRQLSFNKSWEDPQVFDPPLTRKGVEQCLELKERLRSLPNLQTAMWVCSPLSRAIETLLYSCPLDVEQLVARGQLVIKWEVTEFLQTTGDIGLPASCLRRKYPILAPAMDELPEVWWYGTMESNNPFKQQCRAFEPKVAEVKRIAQFRGFLEESTQRTVVAVGHSLFFKHFAGNGDSLSNCGILTMTI